MPRRLLVFALAGLIGCGQESPPLRPEPPAPTTGSASPAATGPITLSARADHGVLELTFTNTTATTRTLATQVVGAPHPNYDWLSVELQGPGGPRTLSFVEDRDRSAVQTIDLAAGASHAERIDLVPWAIAGGGRPLAPGMYTASVRWDAGANVQGVQFTVTVGVAMVIEAPGTDRCDTDHYHAPAGARLELLATQAPTGRATIDVGLHNAGDAAVCIYSYIQTHELQYDWLTVQYDDGGKYHHASRVIHLDDARNKSYPVSVLVGPGQTVWHAIDVDAWARRDRNGAEPLPAGGLYTEVVYDSTREDEVWAGTLRSAPFGLDVK